VLAGDDKWWTIVVACLSRPSCDLFVSFSLLSAQLQISHLNSCFCCLISKFVIVNVMSCRSSIELNQTLFTLRDGDLLSERNIWQIYLWKIVCWFVFCISVKLLLIWSCIHAACALIADSVSVCCYLYAVLYFVYASLFALCSPVLLIAQLHSSSWITLFSDSISPVSNSVRLCT